VRHWRKAAWALAMACSGSGLMEVRAIISPVMGVWTVSGQTFEGGAGDIFVIKAGEIHSFKVVGDSPLVQVDVHLSPHFIQENL